jgi:hypothetical protein
VKKKQRFMKVKKELKNELSLTMYITLLMTLNSIKIETFTVTFTYVLVLRKIC